MDARRNSAASLIATAIGQSLGKMEQRLTDVAEWSGLATEAAYVVSVGSADVQTIPEARLPYHPFVAALPEAPEELFRAIQDDEFRPGTRENAIAKYRDLARSAETVVRAGADMRLARALRKAGKVEAALDVYRDLSRQDGVGVGIPGVPAELIGRAKLCELLAELKRPENLREEAAALAADLAGGRWRLERAAYLKYLRDAHRWLGAGSGREVLRFEDKSGIVVWRTTAERFTALVAAPQYLERVLSPDLAPLLTSQELDVALRDEDGRSVFGQPAPPGPFVTERAASETGLPWTLAVWNVHPEIDLSRANARRRVLLGGLALALVVVSTGSYVVGRAVTRELAVARLQSDFVAAVSHEFRTPLTSLRQATELLADGRLSDAEDMAGAFETQARATDRLQRLVESLLDFGRIEAGRKQFRRQRLELGPWVRSVVDEARRDFDRVNGHIELRVHDGKEAPPDVHADPDALGYALRNLIENGIKYSLENPHVWVDVSREKGHATIDVRDEGPGIPANEQKAIFRKFVRGAASKVNGIKGTGVGLTMANEIVRAHGGTIRLKSAPGKGSTFTILLPEAGS